MINNDFYVIKIFIHEQFGNVAGDRKPLDRTVEAVLRRKLFLSEIFFLPRCLIETEKSIFWVLPATGKKIPGRRREVSEPVLCREKKIVRFRKKTLLKNERKF